MQKIDTYVIPQWAVCPLEYNDFSDLDADDRATLQKFLASLPGGGKGIWEYHDGQFVTRRNAINGIKSTCIEATYYC